jgi:hypothetical protein
MTGAAVGWKAECILVNENGPGYFGGMPPHRRERASSLLAQLYPGANVRAVCDSNLLDELVPPESHFAFGAYDAGCVLSDWYEVIGCATDGSKPIMQRCLSLFPQAALLVLELGSVTNMFGYALYEKGTLRRAYAGDAQDGITADSGQPLPEEENFFRDSEVRAGQRFFRRRVLGQVKEFDAAAVGETLTFHVAARFLGVPFDRFRAELLAMERFRRP